MDATRKFDGRARNYTASRPSYARALIEHLYSRYGISAASVIADIGSGTGKFAKHLLDKGSKVYCVEPNADMRRVAEEELSTYRNFYSVLGTAEHTTLEEASVDHITAAQAFHWFDGNTFKQECLRIIKEGGRVFLVWNIRRDDDPLNQELHQIYSVYCPDFKGFSGGIRRDDQRILDFFDGQYECAAFEPPRPLNRKRFLARSLSGSYSLKAGDDQYEAYITSLNAAFDKYKNDGIVTIANQSVAYCGIIR